MQDHLPPDADRRRLRPRDERRHLDDEVVPRPRRGRRAASRSRGRPASNARTSSGEIGDVRRRRSRTRHFLQVPWPPQVESIAIPFQDAASKTVTPGGTRTAVPDGSKRRATRAGGSAARLPRASGRPSRSLTPSRPVPVRWAAIQFVPHSSRPSSRSAARQASTVWAVRASMIALVRPGVRRRDEERRVQRVAAREGRTTCSRRRASCSGRRCRGCG